MANTPDELRLKGGHFVPYPGHARAGARVDGARQRPNPGTDEMWIRCRGGQELGVAFTGLHDVHRQTSTVRVHTSRMATVPE